MTSQKNAVIRTEQLSMTYQSGEVKVHALKSVDLEIQFASVPSVGRTPRDSAADIGGTLRVVGPVPVLVDSPPVPRSAQHRLLLCGACPDRPFSHGPPLVRRVGPAGVSGSWDSLLGDALPFGRFVPQLSGLRVSTTR